MKGTGMRAFLKGFNFLLIRSRIDALLWSKKSTLAIPSRFLSQKGGTNYLPYAFTE